MPLGGKEEQPNEIIRTVAVVKGNVSFKMLCQPRFNYGMCGHTVRIEDKCAIFTPANQACPSMALYSSIALEQQSQDAASQFSLRSGEAVTFVFGGVRPQGQRPEMERVKHRFHETSRFWKKWIAKSKYKGRWREMVNRSALMLKLLTSCDQGSLIAAPTFSLPEEIGGVRNWDYRFTWLRDGTFTLYALIRLGFVEEAQAFIRWLKERLGDDAERGPLQVMYGVDGRQKLDELTLDHLKGYENSRPVRVGNAAYQQLQLDIYGEMMDCIYLANNMATLFRMQDGRMSSVFWRGWGRTGSGRMKG